MAEMENRIDRISELPDAVLGQILSFLDTRWAVRTTALSKRWQNLVWNSLSTLHFDDSSFRLRYQFDEFIDRVLSRHDKTLPLHKLIFITNYRNRSSTPKFANNLIDYAMSDALQHLQLCFPGGSKDIEHLLNSGVLPMSLRVLKLDAMNELSTEIQTLSCLPKLEILHLLGFRLLPNVLYNCDNLVELSIVQCQIILRKLVICAPQLRSFKMSCVFVSQLTLMLPKLTNFVAELYDIPVIHTDEFFNLKTARLDITTKIEKHEPMINLLQKLCHAQHVSLSFPTFELLHKIGMEVPVSPFSNLRTFKITDTDKNIENGETPMPHKGISTSDINQVLNTVFQSSSDVVSFVHFPRSSKRPRI